MPKWTDSQNNAINARGSNIIVSAAAGSGKTAVLVLRVINMITDENNPVSIDKLLIVTFTNAAAAEMRARIAKSLNKIAAENPNNTLVLEQLSLLPGAKICTIDSFCINLVRENFFSLDISQDFDILDNSDDELLQRRVADEIVEEHYENSNDEFISLVELLSASKNDTALSDTIRSISRYIMAQPFPNDWLDSACELYNPAVSIENSELKKYIFEEIKYNLSVAEELLDNSKSSLYESDELYEKYSHMLDDDTAILNRIKSALNDTWDDLKDALLNASFGRMPYKRNYTSDSKAVISANRDMFKSIITNDCASLMKTSADVFAQDNKKLFPIVTLLCSIVKEFNSRLLGEKNEINKYSFSDIEHFAIDLLFAKAENGEVCVTDLAKEYQNNFYEILVDEYQDTNSAQDKLFETISNGKNRFMVGDVKQSIYRFRLAMPQIFNSKRDTYTLYNEISDSVKQKIFLDMNFRSRSDICSYCNYLFAQLMSKRVGEMDYDSAEYLNYGANYDKTSVPSAVIRICDCPEGENKDEYEAYQIAHLINEKIKNKEQVKDGDSYRNINYGDFAVLFRSAKNSIPIYSRIFEECNIPVAAGNKINLFENNEISILLSLIRVIDNPIQDVPLLATLMSVFYGYTPDDIANARLMRSAPNLYSSIVADKEHFAKFLDDLNAYRKAAATMSLESFIRYIIETASYISLISAMGNAEQRKLNIMRFLQIAKNFDSGSNVGLTAFVRYVDSIINSKLSVESADINHSGEQSVLLMSVHHSKGLEFPIVILAGSEKQYNTFDLSALTQLNSKWGIGLKVNNEELLCRYNSLQYTCIKSVNFYASMSENLRVLYVAVTRAKEQFITFATFKNGTYADHINKLSSKLYCNKIIPLSVKGINNDGDLILLCALLHKDGKILRDCCENDIKPLHNGFDFNLDIQVISGEIENTSDEQTDVKPNDELVEQIREKLTFKYERSELASFASKRTASTLDEKEQSYRFFATSKPAFLNESGMTAAEKGTAMHAFMQYCDYSNAKSDLESEIARLTDNGYIMPEQAKSLSRDKLKTLFESDFASRMFNADKIYREIKVSSYVPVNQIEDTQYTDSVLIQGIADCVFEENGELVLVDYKTDRVSSEEELLDLYKNQIAFYRKAVEKTLKKPVKEAVLYSFALNKICIYK